MALGSQKEKPFSHRVCWDKAQDQRMSRQNPLGSFMSTHIPEGTDKTLQGSSRARPPVLTLSFYLGWRRAVLTVQFVEKSMVTEYP